ncbi:MAG TPA: aryl-sulfate sulfotransferase [Candidatus Eremiobacteraceae bacterium]|nr:aryl-sulfate sulfotransferase [Candidatus Eremiobacteraceae bacterium]
MKPLLNGHILFSITQANVPTILREVDLTGYTIREMNAPILAAKMQAAGFDFVPTEYHHDLLPLPNGHVIVLTNFTKQFNNLPGYSGTTEVIGDGVIDLDENWNPVWAWNTFDYLDVNRHPFGLPDWTHGNTLMYSPGDGNIVFSMRNQSLILKIDYNNGAGSGNIVWRLGYQGDFALTAGGVPTDDPSMWFSGQHFPSLISQTLPQTTLAIWDNGDNRVLDTSGATCGPRPRLSPAIREQPYFRLMKVPWWPIWPGTIYQESTGYGAGALINWRTGTSNSMATPSPLRQFQTKLPGYERSHKLPLRR